MDLYDLYGSEQPEATKEPTPPPVVDHKAALPPPWFTTLEEADREKIMAQLRDGNLAALVEEKVASESKLKEVESYFANDSFVSLGDRLKSVIFTKKASVKKKSVPLTFFKGGIVFQSEGQAQKKGISLWWKLIALRKTEGGETAPVDLAKFEKEMIETNPGVLPGESWKFQFAWDQIELVFDKYPSVNSLGEAWKKAQLQMMKNHPKMKGLDMEEMKSKMNTARLEFGAKWDGRSKTGVPEQHKTQLRFYTGQFVKCNCGNPIIPAWQCGRVIGFWYKEPYFPAEHPGFPYQVCLENGQLIFAPADNDMVVRAVKKEEFKALSERTRTANVRELTKNVHMTVQKLMPKLAQGLEPTDAEWEEAESKCPDLERDTARKMAKLMLMQRMQQQMGHGHSHGGKACDGHHGAPAGHAAGGHGGHSHGPPPAASGHGHTHGGKACDGHHGANPAAKKSN